ncbi:MAG: hypothetical protein IPH82_21085 [Chloroflexi bacterium]|nr:hypothetical protein [Chloroflexota bacterium]
MAKFLISPTTGSFPQNIITARLGAGASNTRFTDVDVGKGVKLVGDSRYGLLSAADPIEGICTSVETGVYDTYVIGGVQTKGYVNATAYGLQATPGTGVIAVGEYVYAAAPAAVQVAETLSTTLRVVSATTQATAAGLPFKARVVSLGPVGTGAVGTAIVIELL